VAPYDGGVVGRFIKGKPRPHLLADAAFRKGMAQLDRFELSFDAWVYHPQLGELSDLAEAFPATPIIVNHVGGLIGVEDYRPERAANVERWRRDLRSLAARPNVSIKIGGLGMPVFGFGFEHAGRPATSPELARAWWPLIETCIEAFGPGRCMFEGNFPVDKQSCRYPELWNAFKLASRHLSADERSDLFHRTACRVYRLPDIEALEGLA
jgi:predicted TIM-barrel fold metal-dependent hydrolase